MKLRTLFFLLLFSFSLSAQDSIQDAHLPPYYVGYDTSFILASDGHLVLANARPKYNWWRGALVGGVGLISGAAWGVHETAVHKPWNFPDNWNPQWWDASLSWRNKYKYGDPFYGERFPGSSTWFVATTDAKHASATIHKAGLVAGGLMVGLRINRETKWEFAIVEALLYSVGYMIGFQSTYVYNAWNW